MCVSGVRNISFSGTFVYVLNESSPISDLIWQHDTTVLKPRVAGWINPIHASVPFLCPLKTLENLWFSNGFKRDWNGPLVR